MAEALGIISKAIKAATSPLVFPFQVTPVFSCPIPWVACFITPPILYQVVSCLAHWIEEVNNDFP